MAEKKILTLYEKLAKITEAMDVLQKDKTGFNYKYVTMEQILPKFRLLMEQLRLFLYPQIVPGKTIVKEINYVKKKVLKTGEIKEEFIHEMSIQGDMLFTWINLDDDSQKLQVPWTFTGEQDDSSKSFGSALSYCTRYFLLDFFNIATTEDDPDNWRSKQDKIEDDQKKEVLKAITDEINDLVVEYMGKDKDKEKAAKIKAFLMDNNGDDPDYTKIKDVEIASALRNKIKEFVRGKKEE